MCQLACTIVLQHKDELADTVIVGLGIDTGAIVTFDVHCAPTNRPTFSVICRDRSDHFNLIMMICLSSLSLYVWKQNDRLYSKWIDRRLAGISFHNISIINLTNTCNIMKNSSKFQTSLSLYFSYWAQSCVIHLTSNMHLLLCHIHVHVQFQILWIISNRGVINATKGRESIHNCRRPK